MFSDFRTQGRLIHLLAGTLLLVSLLPAHAEETPLNELTDITLNPQGDMILNVTGGGFDPQLQSRRLPNGAYQITIGARNVVINPKNIATLEGRFKHWLPAVQECLLASDSYGFQLNLTSWQPLQPQVKSNTGTQVVIGLNGNSQHPAAMLAQPEKEAPQAEPEKKLAAERVLQHQKEQAETARMAAIQKQQATTKANALMAKQKRQEAERLQTVKALTPLPHLPFIALGGTAIDTDWQARGLQHPVAMPAVDEPVVDDVVELTPTRKSKEQLTSLFPHFDQVDPALTPQRLMQDRKPPLGEPVSFSDAVPPDDETAPSAPLKLQKTPEGYDPDSKTQQVYRNFPADAVSGSEYATSAEPAVRRAWESMQLGHSDNAELDLQSFLARNPHHIEARYLLALLLEQKTRKAVRSNKDTDKNQFENTRAELLNIVNQQAFLPAYLKLVDLYLDEGNLSEAAHWLDKIIPRYQQSAEIWFHQGRLMEFKNELDEAQAAYTNALALDAKHPEYHYRLAQVHLKREQWHACRLELLQTLAISPDDARCWKLLGYLAERQGDLQQAAQWYKASLQPDVLIYYARLLEKQSQSQQALALYQAVETMAGDDPDLLFSLAMIYSEGPHPQRTEALLKRFLKLSTHENDARVTQAKALLKSMKR